MSENASEQMYTLAQAKRELGRIECARYGCRWGVINDLAGNPVRLTCSECEKTYPVGRDA